MARSWPRRLWTWHASQTSAWQPRLPRQMSARFTPVRHRRVRESGVVAARGDGVPVGSYVRERYMKEKSPSGRRKAPTTSSPHSSQRRSAGARP
jgi:hypothetical protein